MEFDDWMSGVLVAYIITSSYRQPDLEPRMKALSTKLTKIQIDWWPNAFITRSCSSGDCRIASCVAWSESLLVPLACLPCVCQ